MNDYSLVLITVPNQETADRFAVGLVEEGLVACVNILPGVRSVYRWEGTIHQDEECLLLCKTKPQLWISLEAWVVRHHPYTTPEIIQLPIEMGFEPYLTWINASLMGTTP